VGRKPIQKNKRGPYRFANVVNTRELGRPLVLIIVNMEPTMGHVGGPGGSFMSNFLLILSTNRSDNNKTTRLVRNTTGKLHSAELPMSFNGIDAKSESG
jgi:hypothetical protein